MEYHYQFLWLFSFLILWSHLILEIKATAAEALPQCPSSFTDISCNDSNSGGYYCLKNNLIYNLNTASDATCKEALSTPGINIFDVSKDSNNVYTTNIVKITDSTDLVAANLVIYICDTTCTRTYGYILVNSKYYYVGVSESKEITIADTDTSCTESEIGKLYKSGSDIKLCLAAGIGSQKIDTTDTVKNYVMKNVSGNIFTGGSSNTDKYIKISANEKIIIYNEIANDSYAILSTSSVILGTKTEKNDDKTWDMLYTCTGSFCTGKAFCQLDGTGFIGCSVGYYITSATSAKTLSTAADTEGDLYKCEDNDGTMTCTKQDPIPKGYFMNNDLISNESIPYIKCNGTKCTSISVTSTACDGTGVKIGDIIKTTSGGSTTYSVCFATSSSGAVGLTTSNDGKKYFMDIHTNSDNPFGNVAKKFGIVQIEGGNISIQAINDGYYIGSTTNNEIMSEENKEGTLYNCATTCAAVDATNIQLGYYLNTGKNDVDNGHYIKCSSTTSGGNTTKSCKTIKIEKTACGGANGASTGEIFLKDNTPKYGLCIDSTASTAVSVELNSASETIDKYIISINGNGNVFGQQDNTFALINIDKLNVYLPTSGNTAGYYIVDTSNKILATAGNGVLYNCTGTSSLTCVAVNEVGFYKNVDTTVQYTQCSYSEATPPILTCNGLASLSGTCGASTENGKVSTGGLCLNGSKTASFVASGASPSTIQYMVEYGDDSIFKNSITTSGNYGIIKVTETSMTLDTTITGNKEVCVDSDQKVTSLSDSAECASGSTLYSLCSSGICQKICKVGTGVNCEDKTYYLVTDADSSTPITDTTTAGYLYYCTTSGGTTSCTEKKDTGYYVNDKDNVFSCSGTSGECNKEGELPENCDANNIGKLFFASSAVSICLNYDGSNAISKKIVDASNPDNGSFLLTYGSDNIFGVTEGKMGLVTIVDQSVTLQSSDGNCIESSATTNTLATNDVAGKLYSCTSGICSIVNDNEIKVGYYRNIGSTALGTTDYIKCEATSSSTTVDGATLTTITKTCKGLNVSSATNCSGATVGDLIYVTTGSGDSAVTIYKICLTTDIPIELSTEGTNDNQYFIDVNGTIVFGTKASSYVIIRISNENVFLEEKETGINLYRYCESTDQKLLPDNSYDPSNCSGNPLKPASVLEFELQDAVNDDDITNYYTKTYPTL